MLLIFKLAMLRQEEIKLSSATRQNDGEVGSNKKV